MIKRPAPATRKRYQPTGWQLLAAAAKGAGMGALLTLIAVKLL